MSLYAVKTSLTPSSILLHLRLLVGSKKQDSRKEQMDIITGCLDASSELMLKPQSMNGSKGLIIH